MNKKRFRQLVFMLLCVLIAGGGIAYGAFSDRGQVLGTAVTVGSADIKLLEDLAGGVDAQNLVDAINGPLFEQIGQNWTQDYLVKLFNNATDTLDITSVADYETANDENDLRQDINVEIIVWDDVNGDGILDGGEEGVSTGKKSIVKWKTEGFDITSIEPGNTLGLIVRFSVENLSDTKQGAQITFDFEFNATAQE